MASAADGDGVSAAGGSAAADAVSTSGKDEMMDSPSAKFEVSGDCAEAI